MLFFRTERTTLLNELGEGRASPCGPRCRPILHFFEIDRPQAILELGISPFCREFLYETMTSSL